MPTLCCSVIWYLVPGTVFAFMQYGWIHLVVSVFTMTKKRIIDLHQNVEPHVHIFGISANVLIKHDLENNHKRIIVTNIIDNEN